MGRTPMVVAAAVAVLLAGCGGPGEVAAPVDAPSPSSTPSEVATSTAPAPSPSAEASPSASASASPTAVASPVPWEALSITFDVAGGCYDTADTSACGEFPAPPVVDDELRGRIAEAAPRLAEVPVGDNGCGDEYVDGVSVWAYIELLRADVVVIHPVCLLAVPEDDPLHDALWDLYDEAGGP